MSLQSFFLPYNKLYFFFHPGAQNKCDKQSALCSLAHDCCRLDLMRLSGKLTIIMCDYGGQDMGALISGQLFF